MLRADFALLSKKQKILETRLDELPKCSCDEAITNMAKKLDLLGEADKTRKEQLTSAKESIAALQDTVKDLKLKKECNCGKDKPKITQSIGSPLVRSMSAAKTDKKPAWNAYAGKSK